MASLLANFHSEQEGRKERRKVRARRRKDKVASEGNADKTAAEAAGYAMFSQPRKGKAMLDTPCQMM
jgi:hypothetical protein